MRFLIIDDNPSDRELIIRELRREFADAEFREIIRRTDFEEALSEGGFDVVITDYRLQWTDGLWVLQQLKEKYPELPVVMATDSGGEQIAVEGMKRGLSDYVLKRNLRRLTLAVSESLEKARLRSEHDEAIRRLKAAEELLRRQRAALEAGDVAGARKKVSLSYQMDTGRRIVVEELVALIHTAVCASP